MSDQLTAIPCLAAIMIYPIKSLDGVSVPEAAIRPSGGLRWDREFVITDAEGKKINGKRTPRIHDLRAMFDLARERVSFSETISRDPSVFDLNDTPGLETWLTKFFEQPVTLRRDSINGFPDDVTRPGPTVLSDASIAEVSAWYPDDNPAQMGRRFRANLIVSGVSAFWEDRLIGDGERGVCFKIGDAAFDGVNPCARCIVVTRDPVTGASTPEFQQVFTERRRETLPGDVDAARFNHFFRLATNTRVPESETGKVIRVGDRVQIEKP